MGEAAPSATPRHATPTPTPTPLPTPRHPHVAHAKRRLALGRGRGWGNAAMGWANGGSAGASDPGRSGWKGAPRSCHEGAPDF